MSVFTKMKSLLSGVDSRAGGRTTRRFIGESFTGAWQQNVALDNRDGILSFSAVFGCISGISGDIAKLQPCLMKRENDINVKMTSGRFVDLLIRPNSYQTWFQFATSWVVSKLTHGNTYALKVRDNQSRVIELHILEPEFVTVLVADSGDVYYQIKRDDLSQAKDATVPASEIIHDRGVTLYHPLVGVTPIYACGMAATMGNAIQSTGAAFFKNKATPGGILSAPGRISDDTAARLKESWQNNHAGSKAGGIAVLGDGLKFERMTMTATDAQLVEQLRFSVEDVARCYRYPLFKLQSGAPIMAGSAEELNLQYYGDALQPLIESMESVLNAGLELPSTMHIELDISGLGRMNSEAQTRTLVDGVKGGILTRNEARARLNQQPKEGGDELMAQQQDYTLPDLAALRERERVAAVQQPVQAAPAASEESEEPDPEEETKAIIARFRKGLLA